MWNTVCNTVCSTPPLGETRQRRFLGGVAPVLSLFAVAIRDGRSETKKSSNGGANRHGGTGTPPPLSAFHNSPLPSPLPVRSKSGRVMGQSRDCFCAIYLRRLSRIGAPITPSLGRCYPADSQRRARRKSAPTSGTVPARSRPGRTAESVRAVARALRCGWLPCSGRGWREECGERAGRCRMPACNPVLCRRYDCCRRVGGRRGIASRRGARTSAPVRVQCGSEGSYGRQGNPAGQSARDRPGASHLADYRSSGRRR